MSDQSSTAQCSSTDRFSRIHVMVERFNEAVTSNAMSYRLDTEVPDESGAPESRRDRIERYADAVVHCATMSMEVEQSLASIMILHQMLQTDWEQIESEALAIKASDRYTPKEAKLASVIKQHHDLWSTVRRLGVSIEVGKRGIDRLKGLQEAASRAAGLLGGPQ